MVKQSHKKYLILFFVLGVMISMCPSQLFAATFTVTKTADTNDGTCDADCSLREAITASSSSDQIEFNIPGADAGCDGAGVCTIAPSSQLPALNDARVTIDGYTQSGAAETTNVFPGIINAQIKIQLDGTALSGTEDGLTVTADDVTIKGLSVVRFPQYGIQMTNAAVARLRVQGCFIGVEPDGTTDAGNGDNGIFLDGANNDDSFVGVDGDGLNNAAERNLISGNGNYGVEIEGDNFRLSGNFIGTDYTGEVSIPNDDHGIYFDAIDDSYIGTNGDGTTDDEEGNLISGNSQHGAMLNQCNRTVIAGNRAGVNRSGTMSLSNALSGVRIWGGSDNRVGTNGDGTSDADERNILSGNTRYGLEFFQGTSATTAGNYIGLDINGSNDVGNTQSGIYVERLGNSIFGTDADGQNDAIEANYISGNDDSGMYFRVLGENHTIWGNYIGVNVSGTGVGNNDHGILCVGTTNFLRVTVGGTTATHENVIAHNGADGSGHGVFLDNDKCYQFDVLRNQIFNNADDGINLDQASGSIGNNDKKQPTITGQVIQGSSLMLYGTAEDAGEQIHIYDADSDGEEGQTFASSGFADASGNWTINLPLAYAAENNLIVVSGTTAVDGTSPFSASYTVAAVPPLPQSLGRVALTNGSTIADTTPTFSFDVYDFYDSNVQYLIEIDDSADFSSLVIEYESANLPEGSFSFTVGQAAGSGTYHTGGGVTELTDLTSYYWRVRGRNEATTSEYVTANSGSIAFNINEVDFTWINDGGDGLWSTAANWVGGAVPGITDEVYFNATSIDNSFVDVAFDGTVNDLNIQSGYLGTITLQRSLLMEEGNFVQADGTFNAGANTLIIENNGADSNGHFTLSGGLFIGPDTSGSEVFSIDRNFTMTGGAFNSHSNGTIMKFVQDGGFDDTTFTCTGNFYSLTGGATVDLNKSANTQVVTLASGCEINMTISSGNAGAITIQSGATLNHYGNWISRGLTNNGAMTLGLGGSNSFANTDGHMVFGGTLNDLDQMSSFDSDGNFGLGNFTINSGSTLSVGASTLTIERDYTNNGTFDINGKTLIFDSGSGSNDDTTFKCSGDFTANTGATVHIQKTDLEQEFTLASGCELDTTVTVGGTVTISAGATMNTTGAWQSKHMANYGALTVSTDGSNSMILDDGGGIFSGTLNDLSNVNAYDADDNNASCEGLTVGSGSTLLLGAEKIYTERCFTVNGTFDLSNKTLIFNDDGGSSDDTELTYTGNIGNIYLEKNNSGRTLILKSNVIVTGDFSWTGGDIENPTDPFTLSIGETLKLDTSHTLGGGNLIVELNGTGSQVIDVATAPTINSDIHINKSSGIATITSNNIALTDDGTYGASFNVVSGTFDASNFNITVGASGTFEVRNNATFRLRGSETINNTDFQTGSTVYLYGDGDAGADSYTLTSLGTTFHHLTLNSLDGATDSFNLGADADVNGNFNLSSGTFDVNGSNSLSVGGDFSNGDTFTASTGTVVLDSSTTSTLYGSTTFYSLTVSASSTRTQFFEAGQTISTNASGTLMFQGSSSGLLYIRSDSSGTQSNLTVNGGENVTWVDAKDNNAGGGNLINPDINSVNSGNLTNWNFPEPPTISNLGLTAYVNGSTIADNDPTLYFDFDDPNNDTVQYRIQIDDTVDFSSPVVDYTSPLQVEGTLSFTVGQATGSGTYNTGSPGMTLTDNTDYYWRVLGTDSVGLSSSYTSGNGGAIAFHLDVVNFTWTNDSGDGLWSTGTNWVGDTAPGDSDTAIFNGTSIANSSIDVSFSGTVDYLDINSGYTGTISMARDFGVDMDLTIDDGIFDGTANAYTLMVGRDLIQAGGTFTPPGTASPSVGLFQIGRTINISAGGTLSKTNKAIHFDDNESYDTSGLNCVGDLNNYTGETNENPKITVANDNQYLNVYSGCNVYLDGDGDTLHPNVYGTLKYGISGTTDLDDINVFSGGTLEIDGNLNVITNLTINSGGTLALDGTDISINRVFTLNGSANLTGKNVTFNDGSAGGVYCTGDFNNYTGNTNVNPYIIMNQVNDYFDVGAGCNVYLDNHTPGNQDWPRVYGKLKVGSTGTTTTREIQVFSGGYYELAGNLNANDEIKVYAGGTMVVSGNTIESGGMHKLGFIDLTGKNLTVNTGGGALNCVGDFNDFGTNSNTNPFISVYTPNAYTTISAGCNVYLDSMSGTGSSLSTWASIYGHLKVAGTAQVGGTTVYNGGIFEVGDDLQVFRTLTVNAGGTVSVSNKVYLEQDLDNNGSFDTSNNDVTFQGANYSATAVNHTEEIRNLTFNKGNPRVITMTNNLNVSGDFSRVDGVVNNPASAYQLNIGGDLNISSTDSFGGSNLTVVMSGTENQSIANNNTASVTSPFQVNKSGGKATFDTNFEVTTGACSFTGHIDLDGNNFECTVGGMSMGADSTLELYGSETFTLPALGANSSVIFTGDGDSAADTYTLTSYFASYDHLILLSSDGTADTYQLGATIDVDENFINSGTFDVNGSNNMTVGGDFSNGGIFTASTGTVTLDTTATATVYGSTSFNNLSITTAGKRVNFEAGQTTSISASGTMTFTGASGNHIVLRSTGTEGSYWYLNKNGGNDVSYVDVQNSDASGSASSIDNSNSIDSGYNINWAFTSTPLNPTGLGPPDKVDGSDETMTSQPYLTFTLDDTDNQNVSYRIQIDDDTGFGSPAIDYQSSFSSEGGKTFTVGQAEGSGTYTVGAENQRLDYGAYYWRVKAIDEDENKSAYALANSGAIAFFMRVITVVNTNDAGTGSLRAAIVSANAESTGGTIEFGIPSSDPGCDGSGICTIGVTSAVFPTITNHGWTINGYTQSGASEGTQNFPSAIDAVVKIAVSGTTFSGTENGFTISANNISIKGLSIYGFDDDGIEVSGTSTNAKIQGNFIGLEPDGETINANAQYGVYFSSANTTGYIGTDGDGIDDASERNIISGNTSAGIYLSGQNIQVSGNFIGTDIDGNTDKGNGSHGVYCNGQGSIIGTNGDYSSRDSYEGNLISGNSNDAISINAACDNTTVAGNRLGTDLTGQFDLGNSNRGVTALTGAANITIGTDGDGTSDSVEGNLISGNDWQGLYLGISSSKVSGNKIGTNLAGTADLGNTTHGIYCTACTSVTIGTDGDGVSDTLEGNTIGGNNSDGIRVDNGGTNNMMIAGNYIGLGADGSHNVGNTGSGIIIINGNSSSVIGTNGDGTSDAAEANYISYNGEGLYIWDVSSTAPGLSIKGNFIGVTPGGTAAGNLGNGIRIQSGSGSVSDNLTIGGSGAFESNTIANNGDAASEHGILSNGSNMTNAQILNNSIYNNFDKGIELNGANNGQVAPTIISERCSGSKVNIIGTTGLSGDTVQLFTADSDDQEGQTYLGEGVADTAGNWRVTIPSASSTVVATASSTVNGTSEFSTSAFSISGSCAGRRRLIKVHNKGKPY